MQRLLVLLVALLIAACGKQPDPQPEGLSVPAKSSLPVRPRATFPEALCWVGRRAWPCALLMAQSNPEAAEAIFARVWPKLRKSCHLRLPPAEATWMPAARQEFRRQTAPATKTK